MPIPTIQFEVDISAFLADAPKQDRDLNRMAKDSILEEAADYHKQHFPSHFSREARTKYHHRPRGRGYMAMKRRVFHSITDLIKTGRTEAQMTRTYQSRVGGSWTGGGEVHATLIYRFPFPAGDNPKTGVKFVDMAKEVTEVAPEHAAEAAQGFRDRLVKRIRQFKDLGGRKKYYATGHALGGRTIYGG